jgi:stearoyl-CoA desaturase (delta-9 desaturase)
MLFMHAACLLAPFTFSWDAFAVFAGLYFITGCLGITLSFHRNLSHKSFKLPKPLEYLFAYCGIQALQGDPIEWVGKRTNVADMENDPFYKFIQKTYPLHPLAAAVALFAWGGLPYLVWGMAVRVVWVYHITWFVNSASHVWGSQSWNTGDLSRNNWWVALLAFGEGWHNNHHAFEYSARHGLEWWQFDPTWYIILAMEKLGLASKVKLPRADHMARLAPTQPAA